MTSTTGSGNGRRHTRAGALRRLGALSIKEARQIVRDPSSILMAFVLPAILLFLFGYALSLDVDHVRLGVVLEDGSPDARSLAAAFAASPSFDITVVRTFARLDRDLVSGRLRGIVVIPQDFSRRLHGAGATPGDRLVIQVLADGSEPNTAAFVQTYARGVVETWLQQQRAGAGMTAASPSRAVPPPGAVIAEPRVWYNAALRSRNFLVPGSIAVVITIVGTLLTAMVVAREWERGTMEALLATPLGIAELVVGKLAPYFVLGMAALSVSVVTAVHVFDVPLRGSIAGLALVSAVFLLPALGQGLLISTLSRNQFVAAQAAMISGFLPAFLLSGFVFDIASMPGPIRALTYVVAARYFVTCLKTVFLVGDVWPLLGPNLLAMAAIGAVFLSATVLCTKRRLD